jgi:cysteine-rich repeat protein
MCKEHLLSSPSLLNPYARLSLTLFGVLIESFVHSTGRTNDRGGLRLCADDLAVVMGSDGRWHHLEECDDGNQVAGDGCSQASHTNMSISI